MLQLQRYIENCLQGNTIFLSGDNNTEKADTLDNGSKVILSDTSGYRYFTAEDMNKNFGSYFEPYILLDLHYQNTFNDIVFNLNNGYTLKLSSELKFSESCSECDAPPLYYYFGIYNNSNLISQLTYKYYPSDCCGDSYYYNNYNAIYINNINISSLSSGDILYNYQYGIKIKDKELPKYDVTINANGGTGTSTLTDKTEITTDDLATIKTQITRDGYILSGLSETSAGSAVTLPYTLTADKTMYCVWAMPDNLQTKVSKLITYGKAQLATKGVTSTATTLREVLDDIVNIS